MSLSSGEVIDRTGHADEVKEARNEIRDKAREIDAEAPGVQEFQKQRLATELMSELGQRTAAAEEVKLEGDKERRTEAIEVKRTVARVLEGVAQGIIKPEDVKAEKLFGDILDNGITNTSASYLHGIIKTYLHEPITFSSDGGQPTRFERDLSTLRESGGIAVHTRLVDILTASPEAYGVTQEQIERFIKPAPKEVFAAGGQQVEIPTQEEKDEHEDLSRKIAVALAQDAKQPNRTLTSIEADAVSAFLGGIDAAGEVAAEAMQKLGVPQADLLRFSQLHPKVIRFIQSEGNPRMTGSSYLDDKIGEAMVEFGESIAINKYLSQDGDGNWEITSENRALIKKSLTKYYYAVFQEMDGNPSKLFNELFQPITHGYYTAGLQGILSKFIQNPTVRERLYGTKSWEFLRSLPNYTQSLYNNAQLFHDLPIYTLNPETHEQWKGFIAQFYPSEVAEIFEGSQLMQLARSEITRYIKNRISQYGNQLPENLFDQWLSTDEQRSIFKDKEALERNLTKRATDLGFEFEDWEINRAISYGRGLGILTLSDLQTMANADPNPSFRSIPDMIKKLKQRHKWSQGHGGYGITYFPEFFTMPIEMYPEKKGFLTRLFRPKKWVPQKIKDLANEKVRSLGEELDYKLLDRDGAYQELMSIFDLGDQFTRAGWRMSHLKPGGGDTNSRTGILLGQSLKEQQLEWSDHEEWGADNWKKFYDIITEELGSGGIWFYMEERQASEMRALMERSLSNIPRKLRPAKPKQGEDGYEDKLKKYHKELDHVVETYVKEGKSFEKIVEIGGEMKTLYEAKEIMEFKIKGDIFHYLMRRSPGDFLLNVQLLVPELMDGFDPKDGESKVSGLWNDNVNYKKLNTHEQFVYDRWGKEGVKELKKIHDWINKLDEKFKDYGYDENDVLTAYMPDENHKDGLIDFSEMKGIKVDQAARKRLHREAVLNYFQQESGTAFERAKLRTEGQKNIAQADLFLQKEDISDPILQDLLFGNEGLVTHLQSFSNKQFKNVETVSDSDFFFLVGKAWSHKNGVDNPTTSDLDNFKVYQDIGNVGQGMLRRLHGDIDAWDKVAGEVGKLDHLLSEAARTRNMAPIMKLHHEIQMTFEDIVGKDLGYKANYLLGSIVSSFFLEHRAARGFPGFITNLPMRLLMGNKVSLSKIHGNRMSMSWDDKAVREYFYNLTYEQHCLAHEKGERWSYDQAKRAFGAETDTHAFSQTTSGIVLLGLYFFYSAMKKSLEEETGKKGR